jgi:hypothetical protein
MWKWVTDVEMGHAASKAYLASEDVDPQAKRFELQAYLFAESLDIPFRKVQV